MNILHPTYILKNEEQRSHHKAHDMPQIHLSTLTVFLLTDTLYIRLLHAFSV
jgi:hypothetical protein